MGPRYIAGEKIWRDDAHADETSGRSCSRQVTVPRLLFADLLAPFLSHLRVVRALGMGTRRRPASVRLCEPLQAPLESRLRFCSQSTKGTSIFVRLMYAR